MARIGACALSSGRLTVAQASSLRRGGPPQAGSLRHYLRDLWYLRRVCFLTTPYGAHYNQLVSVSDDAQNGSVVSSKEAVAVSW